LKKKNQKIKPEARQYQAYLKRKTSCQVSRNSQPQKEHENPSYQPSRERQIQIRQRKPKPAIFLEIMVAVVPASIPEIKQKSLSLHAL
jgi:hypothetical protein